MAVVHGRHTLAGLEACLTGLNREACWQRSIGCTSAPQYQEFAARTLWSLSNAFISAFKSLDPIPQFKATTTAAGMADKERVLAVESNRLELTALEPEA